VLKTTNGRTAMHSLKLIVILAFAFNAMLIASAQDKTATETSGKSTAHTLNKPAVAFEVVSVRKSKATVPSGNGFTLNGFTIRGVPLFMFISLAFDFRDFDRMHGLPSWCLSERFDIEAKVAETDIIKWSTLNNNSRRLALQELLASRFRLMIHHQIIQGSTYDLVVGKRGAQFKVANANDKYQNIKGISQGSVITMSALASLLPSLGVSRPVFDKTGLSGQYKVRLVLDSTNDTFNTTRESLIISALREQLGLELKPSHGPVDHLFIDYIGQPTGN
jgi:uncharacterized protein (TIGR03435 family)